MLFPANGNAHHPVRALYVGPMRRNRDPPFSLQIGTRFLQQENRFPLLLFAAGGRGPVFHAARVDRIFLRQNYNKNSKGPRQYQL